MSAPAGLARTLAACACAGALLGGCGSGTTTVTAGGTPATPSATQASTAATATQPSTTTSQDTTPSPTRTATAPEFTKGEAHAEGTGAAAAVVRAHGYTPNDTSQYHANQTLRVLLATRTGSGDGYAQRAFFFVDGRYIGTDASQPSAGIKLISQGDTEVTLAYPLYRHGNALCCPSGGEARVRFQLDNGMLVPLDPIPPVSSTSGPSRY